MHSLNIKSEPEKIEANYFDKEGREISDPSNPDLAAKIVLGGYSGNPMHYVLFATEGGDRGQMYNYSSPNYSPSLTLADNKAKYELRKVCKEAFNFYMAYLRTGVPSNIHRAMREV